MSPVRSHRTLSPLTAEAGAIKTVYHEERVVAVGQLHGTGRENLQGPMSEAFRRKGKCGPSRRCTDYDRALRKHTWQHTPLCPQFSPGCYADIINRLELSCKMPHLVVLWGSDLPRDLGLRGSMRCLRAKIAAVETNRDRLVGWWPLGGHTIRKCW